MVIYYIMCCFLAFLTFQDCSSFLLKWTSATVGICFVSNVVDRLIWHQSAFGIIFHLGVLFAGVLFIIAIFNYAGMSRLEKVVFISFVVLVVSKVCFTLLHLNGADEMSLLVVVVIALIGAWFLYQKFTGVVTRRKVEVIEVAGLFAGYIFPSIIWLFR